MPNVFSGAGLSVAKPADLPSGWFLRDEVLDCCAKAAETIARGTGHGALPKNALGEWKLEFVLGRLKETAGDRALGLLDGLRVPVPNEAHMLSAWALASGGVHATVNFDDGIEPAYALLRGDAQLPEDAAADFSSALQLWREWLPRKPPPLEVIASIHDFEEWTQRRSGRLLKLHGSVGPAPGDPIVEPVVSDFVEFLPLPEPKRVALEGLFEEPTLITGYSVADGDLYAPLLQLVGEHGARWCDPYPSERLVDDVGTVGVGLERRSAAEGLRSFAGLADLPAWPAVDLGYRAVIARQAEEWREGVDPVGAAEAWSWILLDASQLGAAEELMKAVLGRNCRRGAKRRLADIHFHRSGVKGKQEAARLYRQLLRLLRIGASRRWLALHGDKPCWRDVAVALLAPPTAWLWSWPDRAGAEQRAEATGELAHLALRLCERQFAEGDVIPWRLVPVLLAVGEYARRLSLREAGGHAGMLGQQQLYELRSLGVLAGGQGRMGDRTADEIAGEASRELKALGQRYLDLNNPRGHANTCAGRALAAAAVGDIAQAHRLLDEAWDGYAADGERDASGARLVQGRRRILSRLGRNREGRSPLRTPPRGASAPRGAREP